MTIKNIILIYYLSSSIILVNSFISLPFSYVNKKTGESKPSTSNIKEYFESLIKNPVYTTLNINNKDIQFHITMNRHTTYISESSQQKIEPSVNSRNNSKLYSLDYIGISRAVLSSGNFSFTLNNTQKVILNNASFFTTRALVNESEININKNYYAYEKEEIGFNVYKGNKNNKVAVEYDMDEYDDDGFFPFYDYVPQRKKKSVLKNSGYNIEENTNLITQLIQQNLISSYAFLITYNKNEEKGEIRIGGLPHEYDPKHYEEKYFIYSIISSDKRTPNWCTDFEAIKYGNETLKNGNTAEISLDSGFIIAAMSTKKYFDEIFFENPKYVGYCHEEQIGNYFIKYCDQKVIKEFQSIYFYLSALYNDLNENSYIEFNYNDLFIKYNDNSDNYYFQIVFQYDYYNWILGRPLFKKYPTVFNQEKKIFGFYTQTSEDFISNNKEKGKKTYSLVFIIVIIVLALLLIGVTIAFIVYCSIYVKRSKKAYELDDGDYEYNSASINT